VGEDLCSGFFVAVDFMFLWLASQFARGINDLYRGFFVAADFHLRLFLSAANVMLLWLFGSLIVFLFGAWLIPFAGFIGGLFMITCLLASDVDVRLEGIIFITFLEYL